MWCTKTYGHAEFPSDGVLSPCNTKGYSQKWGSLAQVKVAVEQRYSCYMISRGRLSHAHLFLAPPISGSAVCGGALLSGGDLRLLLSQVEISLGETC